LFYEIADKWEDGFNVMFDEKRSLRDIVNKHAIQAQEIMRTQFPLFRAIVTFGQSETDIPLQAADLFSYEWRKRISDHKNNPAKQARKSYLRLRKRPATLRHYGGKEFQEMKLLANLDSMGFVGAMALHLGVEE
jgi:hypothetical protein